MRYFDNYRLRVSEDGRLTVSYVCRKCGKETEEPADASIPCAASGVAMYHLAEFVCKECYEKEG